MWKSTCKDDVCCQPLLYREFEQFVTCNYCGQTHDITALESTPLEPTDRFGNFLKYVFKRLVSRNSDFPTRGPDLVKVMGYCHYDQKLVSHLLTTYGMDKNTGKARLLRQLTGRATLDCSVFGDKSFLIEARHLNIVGFGKDQSAAEYLIEILEKVEAYNDKKECLVPLYTDGDGHCLVHAVSRALVGRELFWYPLRIGLKQHFIVHIEKYKGMLGNFINSAEWPCIIEECDPDYLPPDGSMVGLRNIHVFGLANLLRRPILLLDCMSGMEAAADYAAVFLPGLNPPMACSNKMGQLNPPLCLGWSSLARNHYIPLVPVKENPLPKFPQSLLPKVWGFPQNLLDSYIKLDDQNCLTIGGDTTLTQSYIAKLTSAMDEQFQARYGVPPAIVTDLYYYQYSNKLVNPPSLQRMTEIAVAPFQEKRFARCLICNSLCLIKLSSQWMRPGGIMYTNARKVLGYLKEDHNYTFLSNGVICKYNTMQDLLYVDSFDASIPCTFCHSAMLRKVRENGEIEYQNGDMTFTPAINAKRCKCGYKHYWKGKEYDNPPLFIPVTFAWNGEIKKDLVAWFQDESDARLNSNVYDVATELLQEHFPGEFGSETLQREIVEQLTDYTKPEYLQKLDSKQALGGGVINLDPTFEVEMPELPSSSGSGNSSSGIVRMKRSLTPTADDIAPSPKHHNSPEPSTSSDLS